VEALADALEEIGAGIPTAGELASDLVAWRERQEATPVGACSEECAIRYTQGERAPTRDEVPV
jgi:hypothetical protein